MKVLGVIQFHQKKFKLLDLSKSRFKGLLGDLPRFFNLVIYGYSANGKTEFCIQLAKELTKFGKVLWLSYEQRHGYDLQKATKRNGMEEENGNFLIADPIGGKKEGVSFLEELDEYLSRRNSADYIFIDSLDYTGFSERDYFFLKEKYEGKKSLIFIAHAHKSGKMKKAISDKLMFDGGMGFLVKDFIAFPEKNRFGGNEPYVIYEERARQRNPLFFTKNLAKK